MASFLACYHKTLLSGCHRPFGDPVLTRLHQGHGFAIYRYPKQALSAL